MSDYVLPAIPLTQAANDPKLLRLGNGLWPEQAKLLRAIEKGPSLHVVAWGRGSSKTTIAALAAVHACLLRPEVRTKLRPKEKGWAACVATNDEQAQQFLDIARGIVEESPLLSRFLESASTEKITFTNGNGIRAFPCTARGIRGWRIFFLVFDEFAHHQEKDGGNQAESIWTALKPSQIRFGPMARTLVISTPAGTQGKFWELFTQAESGELKGAMAHQAATWDVDPDVDEFYLAREREEIGEQAFWAEYGARFQAGEGLLFERESLNMVSRTDSSVDPSLGRGWIAALDPASGGGDPFALAIVGRDARPGYDGRLLVGHLQRWLPRKGVAPGRRTQSERDLWVGRVLDGVADVVRRYGATCISDQHVPGVVQDELRKRGVDRVSVRAWTADARLQAFRSLRSRVETERIEIPWNDTLVAELGRVRTRYVGGGQQISIGRAGDSHGDLAIATALATLELDTYSTAPTKARLARPSIRQAVAPV